MRVREFDFRFFMVSRSLGSLCDQFLLFAVPLAVLKATGSAGDTALAFVIEWLPRVLGFPLVGALIDGLPLKRVFFVLDVIRVLLLLTAAVAIHAFGAFGTLTVLMACMSICFVVNFLGIEATIPNNVPREHFPRAHSLVQGVEQTSQVVGPALAALLYEIGSIACVLVACSILFALSSANIAMLRVRDASASNSAAISRVVSTNRLAVAILMERREVLYLSGLTWAVNFVYGTALAISAAVTVQHFRQGPSSFGALQSAAALVAVGVFAVIPRLVRRTGVAFLGRLSLAVMIAAGFALGLAPGFALYAAAYCLLMAFDGGFSVYIRTMRSTILPKEHLGKSMGILGALNLLSIPVSGGLVSVLAGHVPLPTIILLSTVISVLMCAAMMLYGKYGLQYRNYLPQALPARPEPVLSAAGQEG